MHLDIKTCLARAFEFWLAFCGIYQDKDMPTS